MRHKSNTSPKDTQIENSEPARRHSDLKTTDQPLYDTVLIAVVVVAFVSIASGLIYFKYYRNNDSSSNQSQETATQTNQGIAKQDEPQVTALDYPIVGTGQDACYNDSVEIPCPGEDSPFYGQDANYSSDQPSYTDNGDGTITDNITGLMWSRDPGDKMTYDEAVSDVNNFELAGYDDWRIPSIKELYSLIDFRGTDPDPEDTETPGLQPFIDADFFSFEYGDPANGERIIDSQYGSSTKYVSKTGAHNEETLFGVNMADGRIKGYGMKIQNREKTFFFVYVRGNEYGENSFGESDGAIITDSATGLSWQKKDSGDGMTWKDALEYCENLVIAGYSDWRLPNAKELQSIVDYSRSPDATNGPAIDPLFYTSKIKNEAGETDFPYYWTSTTHVSHQGTGQRAAYLSFGRALGYMGGQWVDVHGAGAQRSDPKSGDPGEYPFGHGPQGDAIRILNHVRCVRG